MMDAVEHGANEGIPVMEPLRGGGAAFTSAAQAERGKRTQQVCHIVDQ